MGLSDKGATGLVVAVGIDFSIGLATSTVGEGFGLDQAWVNGGTLIRGTTSILDGTAAMACATGAGALANGLSLSTARFSGINAGWEVGGVGASFDATGALGGSASPADAGNTDG